jgi:quinol-cytochrome oxidoreductase complex cytochrome b subunit
VVHDQRVTSRVNGGRRIGLMDANRTTSANSIPVSAQRFLSLGTAWLVLALIAVITGIALLPFYHASAGAAYESTAAIQHSAPLRVLRAAHHWASALLILLGAAYLLYGLFAGAYRRPLQIAWVAAVGLVLLVFGLQLTGHLLPWDAQAVSTAGIETGVAANAPVIGPIQARLLRGGGDAVSPRTLTLWYTAHVMLLPLALVLLAALFMLHARRNADRGLTTWPVVGGITALLLLLALVAPAPLGSPASPADYSSFTARSEWYVLPLHALLTLAQRLSPQVAFVGTMVIPGLAVLWLLALPWLDQRLIHHPPSHKVRGAVVAGVAAVVVLMLMYLGSMEPIFGARGGSQSNPVAPQSAATHVTLDQVLVKKGKMLFEQNGCAGCHKVGGQGRAVGPPLDGEGTRHPDLNWQIQHLKDPPAMTPGSTMPAYKQLSDSDLRALAMYLLSLKPPG